jgi:hypothetical protein
MAKYDGLIIPRSYNDYINKSDPLGVSQALQLTGVMDDTPTAGSSKPVKSSGLVGISAVDVVETGNMHPVTSNAVAETAADLAPVDEVTLNIMQAVTSNAVYGELIDRKKIKSVSITATSDAGGNVATSLNKNSVLPLSFNPSWSTSELIKWSFGTYGGLVYIIVNKTNSTVTGTLYYIEI